MTNRPLHRCGSALLAAAIGLAGARAARAQPVRPLRIAVLVGANEAAPGRAKLLFGHDDAVKMASALTSVGGFRQQDVYVLADPSVDQLMLTLQGAIDRLVDRPESLLYFYYSGHADEQALYPGGHRLPVARLQGLIDAANISVRIGMVDACRGGGWTRAKGLRPDDPFPVRWPLSLETEGSVLIASSSGLESAHESDQLQGSFFTHHFAMGLRGAADRNGNGEVTITEAFEYAKERTIRDTLKVARDPQHPSYAVNLRGRRDLVLSQLAQGSSNLELSQTHGPLELVHLESGVSLLELPDGERRVRLSVPPGVYLVRKKFPASILTKEVTVKPGKTTVVDEADLALVGSSQLVVKGPPLRPPVDELAATPGKRQVSPWVKLGAGTALVSSALALALSFKFALDLQSVNRDLDPYRRYPCASNPGGPPSCASNGTTPLRPITGDEDRYVDELQGEGKRIEGYQYTALGTSIAFGLAGTALLAYWLYAPDESTHALHLTPTYAAGAPGLAAAARF